MAATDPTVTGSNPGAMEAKRKQNAREYFEAHDFLDTLRIKRMSNQTLKERIDILHCRHLHDSMGEPDSAEPVSTDREKEAPSDASEGREPERFVTVVAVFRPGDLAREVLDALDMPADVDETKAEQRAITAAVENWFADSKVAPAGVVAFGGLVEADLARAAAA